MTVGAFLNGNGGHLLIGIRDQGSIIVGIEPEFQHNSVDRNRRSWDGWSSKFFEIINLHLRMFGEPNAVQAFGPQHLSLHRLEDDGAIVACLEVRALPRTSAIVMRNTGAEKSPTLPMRQNESTVPVEGLAAERYLLNRFLGSPSTALP